MRWPSLVSGYINGSNIHRDLYIELAGTRVCGLSQKIKISFLTEGRALVLSASFTLLWK